MHHHRNVLIEGPTGTGKTYLVCVLSQAASERVLSARYFRASRLFEMFTIAHADGSYGQLLTQLQKAEILIINDWGLVELKRANERPYRKYWKTAMIAAARSSLVNCRLSTGMK